MGHGAVVLEGWCAPVEHLQPPQRDGAHIGDLQGTVCQTALHRSGDRLHRVAVPKGTKVAHYFTRIDGRPVALAGLWERWTAKDKSERKETFTVVTTDPN